MNYLRSLLPGGQANSSTPAPLYTPGMRQNKINAANDPYNRYYKPRNAGAGMPRPPSNADAARMDELLNINTFKRPLTNPEVNELRSFNAKYGLPPVVRYSESAGRYLGKRNAYVRALRNGTAKRSNYNNLRRAENMFNFPHQVNAPQNAPEEGYVGVPMANVIGSIIKVNQGGKRKTRGKKRKSTTRRKRN
jgi:hypothetical protein